VSSASIRRCTIPRHRTARSIIAVNAYRRTGEARRRPLRQACGPTRRCRYTAELAERWRHANEPEAIEQALRPGNVERQRCASPTIASAPLPSGLDPFRVDGTGGQGELRAFDKESGRRPTLFAGAAFVLLAELTGLAQFPGSASLRPDLPTTQAALGAPGPRRPSR